MSMNLQNQILWKYHYPIIILTGAFLKEIGKRYANFWHWSNYPIFVNISRTIYDKPVVRI